MPDRFFDLIVVGDGPAGCAAAIAAAEAGLSVAMLGRDRIVKHDVPESLHPAAEELCRRLGVPSALSDAAVGRRYYGVSVRNLVGLVSEHALGFDDEAGAWRGYHVRRDRFDAALRRRAKELGVFATASTPGLRPLRVAGRVAGVTSGETDLLAAMVVDASGRAQWSRRHLGLERKRLSAPLLAWRGLADGNAPGLDRPQFHMRSDAWWWIVGLPDGTACTGVCRLTDDSRVPDLPLGLWPRDAGAWADRTWHYQRPLAAPGLLLCGDAAGWLDPAAGDGVVLALQSGINAAVTLQRCLARPAREALELALYDDWWCRRLEHKAGVLRELYAQAGLVLPLDAAVETNHQHPRSCPVRPHPGPNGLTFGP